MSLSELIEAIKSIDPFFNYQRVKELETQVTWYRDNDMLKTNQIQKLREDLDECRSTAGVPISPPIATKVVNSSSDIAPIFMGNPHLAKAYLCVTSGTYKATTLAEIDRFVDAASLDLEHVPFIADHRDCGQFATALIGKFCATPGWEETPIGILVIGSHVMCIGVAYEDITLTSLVGFVLEPQTKARVTLATITELVSLVFMA